MAFIAKMNSMPTLDASVRSKNFKEVALGYSANVAIEEAKRCLNCKNKPCVTGCPANIDIPGFISHVKNNDFDKAFEVISQSSCLPAVCGRVCPQESQCESKCTMGVKFEPVGIGRLERFVADYHNSKDSDNEQKAKQVQPNGIKIAIIGSGPSGLSCAGDLVREGFEVSIYEALHLRGGVLSYGIPEFRLPKRIIRKEVDALISQGVKLKTNVVIGKTLDIDDLFEMGYKAIYVSTGAGLPKFMNIPGESLKGVYSANEFLTRVNLMKAYKEGSFTPISTGEKTVVVGGGNVAIDAARCAIRLGSKVTVVYRRTEKELPARLEEIEHAKEEGIEFMFLTNPIEIKSDENGFVDSIVCRQMKLSEPDESGRARPVEVAGSEFEIKTHSVIMALGTSPNPLIRKTTKGIKFNMHGGIVVDDNGKTSREGIYAGGDAVTGSATVISALGAGKRAAKAIMESLTK